MPETISARIFQGRASMPAASAASSFCRIASSARPKREFSTSMQTIRPATSRPHGDHGVEARIGELQIRRRVLPVHRQRDFLEAEILQQVEDRQRIGEHRQREIVPAQAEGRRADDDRGDRAHDRAERDAEPRRQVPVHQRQRHGIGADAEERTHGRRTAARHSRTGCSTTRRTPPRSAPASGSTGSSCW